MSMRDHGIGSDKAGKWLLISYTCCLLAVILSLTGCVTNDVDTGNTDGSVTESAEQDEREAGNDTNRMVRDGKEYPSLSSDEIEDMLDGDGLPIAKFDGR